MTDQRQAHTASPGPAAATEPLQTAIPTLFTPPIAEAEDAPPSEFVCPGCGRPLRVTLHSDLCFAEAQVFCPDCERDYQERRGRWA